MISAISFMVIAASLLAVMSGIWVIMGLAIELIHPSRTSQEPLLAVSPDPSKKMENSSDLL